MRAFSPTCEHRTAPLERVSATWPVRLQRPSDGLAKASQSARNLLADFCIELGYPCLGGFRALARCIVPRLRLSLLVFALAAKFLETRGEASRAPRRPCVADRPAPFSRAKKVGQVHTAVHHRASRGLRPQS